MTAHLKTTVEAVSTAGALGSTAGVSDMTQRLAHGVSRMGVQMPHTTSHAAPLTTQRTHQAAFESTKLMPPDFDKRLSQTSIEYMLVVNITSQEHLDFTYLRSDLTLAPIVPRITTPMPLHVAIYSISLSPIAFPT